MIEMKSILKKVNEKVTGASSSIGAVRWTLPEKDVKSHSSVPSSQANTLSGGSQHQQQQPQQQHPRQNGLKDLRSLQECVHFIQHWKEQVHQVCKQGDADSEAASSSSGSGDEAKLSSSERRAERSLEESRKLILQWADELRHVDELLKNTSWALERVNKENETDAGEETQLRMMEWAKELQKASERCGVQSEELGKVLRLLGLKKKRLVKLLPLLEFITWSLLKEDSMKMIPNLWLLAKQPSWKDGIPRYIPNSVWSWICSAAADVVLDPMTIHPWLLLSDDQRGVQEGLSASDLPYSPQRFDSWPCVLAWEGYGSGRHYWEVDIANDGYWRVGLTTVDSKRHGRFAMTPKQGYWVLWRSTHQFYACTKPETPLPQSMVPRRMGVYLDYEEGQISFYNAESKSHIYTFTGTFKGKLYPLFAPLDGRTLMRITPKHKIR